MDIKQYADLRVREARLKMSRGVSEVISSILATLLLIVVLGIVLGLAAVVLLQWLNSILGMPWGSLVVLGLFLVLFFILWALRKKLFRGVFVGTLSGDSRISSSQDLDREIARVDGKIDEYHARTVEFMDEVKETCGIVNKGIHIGTALINCLKKKF